MKELIEVISTLILLLASVILSNYVQTETKVVFYLNQLILVALFLFYFHKATRRKC